MNILFSLFPRVALGILSAGISIAHGDQALDPSVAFPGTGYYSGIDRTNLPASSVCSGSSLFGIPGSALCQQGTSSTPASTSEVLAGKEFFDQTGTRQTGTMITRGTWDLRTAFPGPGLYSAATNAPTSSQIVAGSTVFGVNGSLANTWTDITPALAHKDRGVYPLSLTTERNLGACSISPFNHRGSCEKSGGTWTSYVTTTSLNYSRPIPKIAKDDDGYTGGSVTYATRPSVVCGMGITSVRGRLADCEARNAASAVWDGAYYGNASFGYWSLVTAYKAGAANGDACSGSCSEVWMDEQTGLLWSSPLGGSSNFTNWCKASGSSNSPNVAAELREVDPTGECIDPAYQDPVNPESWCYEASGLNTPATYDAMKGGMRATATGQSPAVLWRLPTAYDFYQADINGLRFVLPGQDQYFWTATVMSNPRNNAFAFYGRYGHTINDQRVAMHAVICVGR